MAFEPHQGWLDQRRLLRRLYDSGAGIGRQHPKAERKRPPRRVASSFVQCVRQEPTPSSRSIRRSARRLPAISGHNPDTFSSSRTRDTPGLCRGGPGPKPVLTPPPSQSGRILYGGETGNSRSGQELPFRPDARGVSEVFTRRRLGTRAHRQERSHHRPDFRLSGSL